MLASIMLAATFLVAEGPEWVPVKPGKDPFPGSALDFSGMGLQKGPCGKYGRIVVRNGHFEFEKMPGVAQRFFGGNVGSDTPYPESDEEAEDLAARFCRLGYNSLRIHHHDAKAVAGSSDGVTLNEAAMAKMDSFVAAMWANAPFTPLYATHRPFIRRCCQRLLTSIVSWRNCR